jgi:ketose-bisphosphate aldolase
MFDGSALPFAENVRLTRQVVAEAHDAGTWVEAELVGYAGDEDRSVAASAPASMTDPDVAARFVERTGVDALAVAIGNVHGMAATPARLDFELLARIRAAVDVPLVLHGASGLPDDEVRAAIALGVAKINVNTELRRAYLGAARAALSAGDDDLAGLLAAATAAVRDVAREKIAVYRGPSASGREVAA